MVLDSVMTTLVPMTLKLEYYKKTSQLVLLVMLSVICEFEE